MPAAAQTAAKRGGRTQQGNTPAPTPAAPGQFGPPRGSPPSPTSTSSSGPRTGGRTQQGQRGGGQRPRTGGRTQQASSPAPAASSPAPAAPAAPAARAPTSTRINTASREGSGALLVLFAYPMAFNLLRHGPAGLRAWLKAKFINEPEPPGGSSTGPATRKLGPPARPPAQSHMGAR